MNSTSSIVKEIRIEDFDYSLPAERIALHPLQKRDECKLLLVRPDGRISHRIFKELAGLLPIGSMMVCNDTRVINARLEFYKETGARIEIFLLEPLLPADYAMMFQTKGRCVWRCLVGNLKKWKEETLSIKFKIPEKEISVNLCARRLPESKEEGVAIEFSWTPTVLPFATIIEAAGQIPIPPYLNRKSEKSDLTDYQTIYAIHEGSVAAPTAGLHFSPDILDDLDAHNIPVEKLTLHVGAGTFKPVKAKVIGGHEMHTEIFSVSLDLIEKLIRQKEEGKPVVAVGTTSVRSLESLPILGYHINQGNKTLHVSQWEAYESKENLDTVSCLRYLKEYMKNERLLSITASTAIMIAPGFKWRITDGMITNFHQPQSTLLLLVSAFLGKKAEKEVWREAYQEAINNDYRFLSYGDANLYLRPVKE